MKNTILYLSAVSMLLSGCAFKEKSAFEQTFPTSIDWANSGDHSPLLKAQRVLKTIDGVLTTSEPTTLPELLPQEMHLTANLTKSSLPEEVTFTRASILVRGQEFTVPSDEVTTQTKENGRVMLSFRVHGLANLLPKGESFSFTLKVQAFSSTKKVTELNYELRTPPKDLSVRFVPLKEWSERGGHSSMGILRRVEFPAGSLVLTQVIEFEPHEALPVEVEIPRKVDATLAQWVNEKTYRDIGCEGPGFAIDSTPRWESLSQGVFILPLSQNLQKELQATFLEGSQSSIAARMEPGQIAQFGIFALGQSAQGWSDSGPAETTLSPLQVGGTCFQVCMRQGEPTGAHREHPFSLMSCDRWETRRNTATAFVGQERGSVFLKHGAIPVTFRFADLSPNLDSEKRLTEPLPSDLQIDWY